MSYKVKAIPKFEKEMKRLSKKYPSIKSEYLGFIRCLKLRPLQGTPTEMIALKSDWLSLLKERESQEGQE